MPYGESRTGRGAKYFVSVWLPFLFLLLLLRLTPPRFAAAGERAAVAVLAIVPDKPATCRARMTRVEPIGRLQVALRCTGPSPYLISLAAAATVAGINFDDPDSAAPTEMAQAWQVETRTSVADCFAETLQCTAIRANLKVSKVTTIRIAISY